MTHDEVWHTVIGAGAEMPQAKETGQRQSVVV